jgi:hypothetical protein
MKSGKPWFQKEKWKTHVYWGSFFLDFLVFLDKVENENGDICQSKQTQF